MTLKNANIRHKDYAAETKKIVDVRALEHALKKCVTGEVRFDDSSRALYSTDSSNYRQVPLGVVLPKTKQDIINIVKVCREFEAPIVSRGGGTSLAGQSCNVAVVMDLSKYYNQILELDFNRQIARVQPGIVLDELRNAAEKQHFTFGPDPATHSRCTLGGMMGNNSCGVHSVMAGKTEENVLELEVLTYGGDIFTVSSYSETELAQIIDAGGKKGELFLKLKMLREKYAEEIRARYPVIPRRVSGFNLPRLLPEENFDVAKALVGSESTCVVILEATLRIVPSPKRKALLVLGYPSIFEAADHVEEVLAAKPVGLEAMDDILINNMKKKHLHEQDILILPEGHGWLVVEFGGETIESCVAQARALEAKLKKKVDAPTTTISSDTEKQKKFWEVREAGLGATAFLPGEADTWEGWEDSAVPPKNLGIYLRELKKIYDKFGYRGSFYGHFGQGCLHTRINFDVLSAGGIAQFRRFIEESAKLVVSLGGSLSGEHGDGQSRAEFLPLMFGEKLMLAFKEFKTIWDPQGKMNPGKLVEPYRMDENLRYGIRYAPVERATHFKFPDDGGSFVHATTRCVGVGACRQHEGGVMCPSYMVTREEKHSTRGRARLLFEMVQGEVLKKSWREEAVKDALDLCLSCKGCKGECPVNVDMATYKAEFLSHYYKGRIRPRSAYAFGLIGLWARWGAPFAKILNFFTQNKFFAPMAKFMAGVARERQIPKFAEFSFHRWFKERKAKNPFGPKVILWTDTFNTYFHPKVAQAAVTVLEDAGYRVILPKAKLCCGRPLYDYGMLELAKSWLQDILTNLREEIQIGTPVVGLEPSCMAVFREELKAMFPHDIDAQRLCKQSFLLSEFLEKVADYTPPVYQKTAFLKGHCHHSSIFKMDTEKALLKKMKMDVQMLDVGCCGMAGAFGFEKEHYQISQQVGERALLPEVRKADPNAIILANGFSCHEQIKQGAGREALHLSQVIAVAIAQREQEKTEPTPEIIAS